MYICEITGFTCFEKEKFFEQSKSWITWHLEDGKVVPETLVDN